MSQQHSYGPFPASSRPALTDGLGGCLPAEKRWARPSTPEKGQPIRLLSARVMGITPAQHMLQPYTGEQG
jgi:hypothetical protein